MSRLRSILGELRSNRLAPVAALLVIALIAVPTLLASGSSPAGTPVAELPQGAAVPSMSAIPAVSVSDTPAHSRLNGRSRNPFTQATQTSSGSAGTASSSSSAASSSATAASSSSGSSSGSSSSSSGAEPNPNNVGQPFTSMPQTGAPASNKKTAGQVARTVYYVDLAFGPRSEAGYQYDNVKPLTGFPGSQDPELVFLGPARDGKAAVFVFSAAAAVTGPGECIPSLRRCANLELKVGQRETLLARNADGTLSEYSFGVISILKHKSKTTKGLPKLKITTLSHGTLRLIARGQKLVAVFARESTHLAADPAPAQGIGEASDAPTPVTHAALEPVTGGKP